MRRRLVVVATCNLDQWALDFQGNLERVKASITQAKAQGATYRVGPELELPGYGCEDHFYEQDTVDHSWECIEELLKGDLTSNIVCDVGMPVTHGGVRYNCRVFLLNNLVCHIRPKIALADDGNYRESRYFSSWKRGDAVDVYQLPTSLQDLTGRKTCTFGDCALSFADDCTIGVETCEELFTPQAPHIRLALSGVDIISNGSGSHHQLRKLDRRLDLMKSATGKAGGVYLYANQQGCDGGRLYYDGCACIFVNGEFLAQGQQFALSEVEVVTATVDLDEVRSYRAAIASLQHQASAATPIPTVPVDFRLCQAHSQSLPSAPIQPRYHEPEREIAEGPACWLWDYLRRSGASGFLLPLSGGADSSSVAAIVGCMCQMVMRHIQAGDSRVEADALRIGQYRDGEQVASAQELADRVLHTVYMGTQNSSKSTEDRATRLASQIGSYHINCKVDSIVESMASLFTLITGRTARFRVDGGSTAENLALQNIQARLRMVLAFLLAQLGPWVRGRSGFLLVLGSANVDEGLRGYLTKYDCSSADLNPIGGISKGDLKRFLRWGAEHLGYGELAAVVEAAPTAELEPIREGQAVQTDEVDMGMTYEELGVYGRLRKISKLGPVSMFCRLLVLWHDRYSPALIAKRVKDFFKYYSINRHKATTLTPAYHAESYSPDDNRFDHRPFLYNTRWPWQFARIDAIAQDQISGSVPDDAVRNESTSNEKEQKHSQ